MSAFIQELFYGSSLYEDSKRLREEILRRPIGRVLDEKDLQGEDRQIHIAAVEDSFSVVGTVILKPGSSRNITLRQMAVANSAQGRGLGRDLVKTAEVIAAARGFDRVDMHARTEAQGFYEKLGYHTEGDTFIEFGSVPTIIMTRDLLVPTR
ncbi:MAG: GNAT family N-acetyltransferase [Alphaproteobacteria bacterium]|nr:GNAT family N-acetyltransferase [Alphaproteobacteria bacterium]